MFAAEAMGLASSPMTGFDAEPVSEEFELAADEFPVMLLSVGLPRWTTGGRRRAVICRSGLSSLLVTKVALRRI